MRGLSFVARHGGCGLSLMVGVLVCCVSRTVTRVSMEQGFGQRDAARRWPT
jgi:hypothetical protein